MRGPTPEVRYRSLEAYYRTFSRLARNAVTEPPWRPPNPIDLVGRIQTQQGTVPPTSRFASRDEGRGAPPPIDMTARIRARATDGPSSEEKMDAELLRIRMKSPPPPFGATTPRTAATRSARFEAPTPVDIVARIQAADKAEQASARARARR